MGRRSETVNRQPRRIGKFQKIVRTLCANDPDIIEIVQFGSSVYAPRLARDVDLLITTRAKKDYAVYLDAVGFYSKNVDIVVKEPNESMGSDIALSVLAFSKSLYGNGRTRKEAMKHMPIPSFDDARKLLTMADRQLGHAHQEQDKFFREAYYRAAFDFLFDAARYAAMTFLVTDETRWGELPKKLPAPFNKRFREFISTLHVQFSYDDNFPRDQADVKFKEWRERVLIFIEGLAARAQSSGNGPH